MIRCFFFNDTATNEIYTLSLHDALPICFPGGSYGKKRAPYKQVAKDAGYTYVDWNALNGDAEHQHVPADKLLRSEEHTSELQSRQYLVCRLLLEKKKRYSLIAPYIHILF